MGLAEGYDDQRHQGRGGTHRGCAATEDADRPDAASATAAAAGSTHPGRGRGSSRASSSTGTGRSAEDRKPASAGRTTGPSVGGLFARTASWSQEPLSISGKSGTQRRLFSNKPGVFARRTLSSLGSEASSSGSPDRGKLIRLP